MKSISLDGTWHLSYGPQNSAGAPLRPGDAAGPGWQTIAATVPGNVEIDLIKAGRLDEPSVGENIYKLRGLESYAWCYRRLFEAPLVRPGQHVELVLEGVDCVASVWLNGRQIGAVDNMLIAHRFDVTGDLKTHGNELFIRIESAVLAGRSRRVDPAEYGFEVNFESLGIRKAPHMYGWDILPRMVSAGLWRGVRLDILPTTRWREIYFSTAKVWPEKGTARVLLDWDFVTDRVFVDDMKVRVTLGDKDGVAHSSDHEVYGTHGRAFLDLKEIKFWWPRGSGEAHLYELKVALLDGADMEIDAYAARVGIRTISLKRTDLTTPEGTGDFRFIVNEEPVFVHGTNWVPLDALHSRDPQHLEAVFEMVVDLNCNMVRCWGGNVYEDHAFFDLCDRHGVMVWQDFAMGCAIYPQDDDFARRIEAEASSVAAKLRNHASLALWAGNNEIDETYSWAGTGVNPNTDRLSRQVLPAVTRRLDPLREYLPSSPYRAPAFFTQTRPPSEVLPEQHLWGPRNDYKGDTYAKTAAHFASEIGYHGCPNVESLREMMDAQHVWPWQDNPQWLAHAVKPHPKMHKYDYRIPLMAKQIDVLFGKIPENLEDFVLASQISQAEAFKFFIEWFRQGKWRRTGILWWNLRDGWPVISDAIVDYYNRKKLAYLFVKRVQSDVCIICAEPAEGAHQLAAVNDTRKPVKGRMEMRDIDSNRVLHEGTFEVAANGIGRFGRIGASEKPAAWKIKWSLENGGSGENHYLAGPRPFNLDEYKRWLKKI